MGAGFHGPAWACLLVGAVAWRSAGVECLEAFPAGGEVVGPPPAGWDEQGSAAGVDDVSGWGAEESVAQRFRFGFGKIPVQGEVAEPGVQGAGQGGELQPGAVAVPVRRRQVLGAARLEFLHLVFDVGLGAVPGVQPLDLSGGGVGGERAVAPVGVLAEPGLLAGGAGDAADDDTCVGRPAGQRVAAGAVPQNAGQVRDRGVRVGPAVGGQRDPPVGFTQPVDPGLGALIDRPADRVLHPPPRRPCAAAVFNLVR